MQTLFLMHTFPLPPPPKSYGKQAENIERIHTIPQGLNTGDSESHPGMQEDNSGIINIIRIKQNSVRGHVIQYLSPGKVIKLEPLVCVKQKHRKHTHNCILVLLMTCLPYVSLSFY